MNPKQELLWSRWVDLENPCSLRKVLAVFNAPNEAETASSMELLI